jgi:dTDP-4-dehydrorhamnose 3,5-epimerase
METYNAARFRDAGLPDTFVQDNHSHSRRGVVRGLHYQLHEPQGKLVRCTRGRILDAAVDIRRTSPHFGKWVAVELTAENHRMLWIPPRFAHGFAVLSDEAEVLYKHDAVAAQRPTTPSCGTIPTSASTGGSPTSTLREDAKEKRLVEAEVFD